MKTTRSNPKVRNDLRIYDRTDWWDTRSSHFRSLHRVNRSRLSVIDQWLGDSLPGAVVVDLGCGGGLIADALAQRGARVVGVDLSAQALRCGHEHALEGAAGADSAARAPRETGAQLYVRGSVLGAPLGDGRADLVLLSDVLEHLEDIGGALAEAARIVRPGGRVYVSTLNRTRRCRWLAIVVAEGLRLVPPGTHDPDLLVDDAELVDVARERGLELEALQGESVALLETVLTRSVALRPSKDRSVAYSALFRKPGSRS